MMEKLLIMITFMDQIQNQREKIDFGTHDQPQAEPPPPKPPQPVPIYYPGGYKTCHHGHVTAKKYPGNQWQCQRNML